MKWAKTKELHEENLNKEGQENLQNKQNTTESVTEQPTAEELLAEEKTVTFVCMQSLKIIKEEP